MQSVPIDFAVPGSIVPDQTRALIKYPDRYDPEPNRTSAWLATP